MKQDADELYNGNDKKVKQRWIRTFYCVYQIREDFLNKTGKHKDNIIRPGMQVEFICPKCGTHLAWALPDMEMKCPKCGNWVTGQNRKKPKLDLLLPTVDDQLTLF